jgi:hypothetical protein
MNPNNEFEKFKGLTSLRADAPAFESPKLEVNEAIEKARSNLSVVTPESNFG